MTEESIWSANKTDDVVAFPIKVSDNAILKEDLDAIKHLEIIKSTQQNWVIPGTAKVNKKPIVHNVSCTVVVKDDEWSKVIKYLYDNREFFAAVSLLASTGDKDYAQAPMEKVATDDDKAKFDSYVINYSPIDYTKLIEDEDLTTLREEIACGGGKCDLIAA